MKLIFFTITLLLLTIGEANSQVNLENQFSDYDFHILKNYVRCHQHTREVLEPEAKCSSFSLFISDISSTIELVSNCQQWNAIRIVSLNSRGVQFDYYVNQEYQKLSGFVKNCIVITSSFGYKTDSASLINLKQVMEFVKNDLIANEGIHQLKLFLKDEFRYSKNNEQINILSSHILFLDGGLEVIPNDRSIEPYYINLNPQNSKNAYDSSNMVNSTNQLNTDSSPSQFMHFTNLMFELRKDYISRIR